MVVSQVRGERGEKGETGQKGETGPAGPPSSTPDLGPVIQQLTSRMAEADAVRQKARDQELQDEMSRMRMEAERHAETARVLAQASANLTSIPTEIRALASKPPAADPTSHLRQAAANLSAQAATQHQHSMEFLRRNASDLAQFAGQLGGGLARALDSFKPPEREMAVTPSPPPPPPSGGGARIKKAIKKALKPPKPAMTSSSSPPAPAGSRPGSSNDPPINIFGGPAITDYSQMPRRKGELDKIDDMAEDMKRKTKKPETSLVKLKDKKKPPAGLKQQSTIPNHQEKLTKHGPKTIITKTKEPEPKPTPHVPPVDVPPVQGRKRKGADKPPVTGVKRSIPQRTGPGAKRTRRVSAHEI